MSNEQKKRSSKKLCLYIQNGGDDIRKWLNLSTFWKILALGGHIRRTHIRRTHICSRIRRSLCRMYARIL